MDTCYFVMAVHMQLRRDPHSAPPQLRQPRDPALIRCPPRTAIVAAIHEGQDVPRGVGDLPPAGRAGDRTVRRGAGDVAVGMLWQVGAPPRAAPAQRRQTENTRRQQRQARRLGHRADQRPGACNDAKGERATRPIIV